MDTDTLTYTSIGQGNTISIIFSSNQTVLLYLYDKFVKTLTSTVKSVPTNPRQTMNEEKLSDLASKRPKDEEQDEEQNEEDEETRKREREIERRERSNERRITQALCNLNWEFGSARDEVKSRTRQKVWRLNYHSAKVFGKIQEEHEEELARIHEDYEAEFSRLQRKLRRAKKKLKMRRERARHNAIIAEECMDTADSSA